MKTQGVKGGEVKKQNSSSERTEEQNKAIISDRSVAEGFTWT
jgi:hypothetical protein